MVARRSRAKVSRAIAVVALAYVLALQVFLGGLVAGLQARTGPADPLAVASLCSPEEHGGHDSSATRTPEPARHHDEGNLCCILGCGIGSATGISVRHAVITRFDAVQPASYGVFDFPITLSPPIAGALGPRAPPVAA
jgi:hypothetical protein